MTEENRNIRIQKWKEENRSFIEQIAGDPYQEQVEQMPDNTKQIRRRRRSKRLQNYAKATRTLAQHRNTQDTSGEDAIRRGIYSRRRDRLKRRITTKFQSDQSSGFSAWSTEDEWDF
jgi:hypothetical protein